MGEGITDKLSVPATTYPADLLAWGIIKDEDAAGLVEWLRGDETDLQFFDCVCQKQSRFSFSYC